MTEKVVPLCRTIMSSIDKMPWFFVKSVMQGHGIFAYTYRKRAPNTMYRDKGAQGTSMSLVL